MDTNIIYCGDASKVMANHIPDNSIDLIYMDPPFFSNKQYEVLWNDGYELRAFEDRWKGGIENYIAWMEPVIREGHRVLKDTGSMYLHCDWHANAHLRILMDKIFGSKNFRNEIIWAYSTSGRPKDRFPQKHDTIFCYGKTEKTFFNLKEVKEPYSEEYIKTHFPYKDKNGRLYRKRYDAGKWRIYYADEGMIPNDVWDIPYVNSMSPERLGYPTQKPEDLLKRIINASSNITDIVLDPMCGCGTAIAVAHKLARRWIGIDISPTACKLMASRMHNIDSSLNLNQMIIGLPKTLEEIKAMQPFDFQNWVCEKLLARRSQTYSSDKGIDGWLIDGRPLQVKQSESIGRNVIDNFETAIKRARKTRGIVVAFSFGKGSYEEVARAKNEEGLDIELKTVEELLKEV